MGLIERRAALAAELLARRIGGAAGRAAARQARATLTAELLACGILVLAPGAPQGRLPRTLPVTRERWATRSENGKE